jgi:hypothetical protein
MFWVKLVVRESKKKYIIIFVINNFIYFFKFSKKKKNKIKNSWMQRMNGIVINAKNFNKLINKFNFTGHLNI